MIISFVIYIVLILLYDYDYSYSMKEAFERSGGVGGSVYDLEVATQDTIDLNFYFTLSKEGITQYSHKSSQFTSLAQWHREFLLFHMISNIRFFKLYKRWKAFSVWKRGLRGGKMLLAGAALDKNLFLFNPPLRNALLTVRQLSAPLSTMGMLSLPKGEIFDMDDFVHAQSEGEIYLCFFILVICMFFHKHAYCNVFIYTFIHKC
jgi:hypothetical protein